MFDFSKRLLKLRKSRGLSQIELAHKIRISSSTLGNYENDMGIPSLSVAESLADVLNVSLDYLACGEKANVISVKGAKGRTNRTCYRIDSRTCSSSQP